MHLGYIPTFGELLGNWLVRIEGGVGCTWGTSLRLRNYWGIGWFGLKAGADAPGVHSYAWGILGEFADSG